MLREPAIPLFLWIAAAICLHLAGGNGGHQLVEVLEEQRSLARFARSVLRDVQHQSVVFEVDLPDDERPAEDPENPEEPSPVAADPEPATANDRQEEAEPEPEPPEREQVPPPAATEAEKAEETERRREEEEKKPPELLVEKPPPLPPPLAPDRRVAVVQNTQDKNQKDNPNARHIADEANWVEEETQARITSTTQNDQNPTPGGQHTGPTPEPGNSDLHEVAQEEDRAGEPDRAPDPPGQDGPEHFAAAAAPPVTEAASPQTQPGKAPGAAPPEQSGQTAREEQEERSARPDLHQADQGTWASNSPREAQARQAARPARPKRLPPPRRNTVDAYGFGSLALTENGVNLNLTPAAAVAAVGADRLAMERKRDAERRRSQHRGSWQSVGIERWRAALENYVASVKPGNQTALNTARVPFASYLNHIHQRIHPIFADRFLLSLDSLPGNHPMNRREMATHLEIVVSEEDGRLVRMGVTKTSGVTAFDVGALESVSRAAPFGTPPREIVSPDGNVYLHWEFHRNPDFACSTYFAHPYLLKVQPRTAPPRIDPPQRPPLRSPSDERRGSQDRGSLPAVSEAHGRKLARMLVSRWPLV